MMVFEACNGSGLRIRKTRYKRYRQKNKQQEKTQARESTTHGSNTLNKRGRVLKETRQKMMNK